MKNLGIDIGGVIISRVNDDTDTSFFGNNFLQTTAEPEAFKSILSAWDCFDNIALVSKCGDKVRAKTIDWLRHHDFYNATAIDPRDVYFCRKRFEKLYVCEGLKISSFVDDRLEILAYMVGVVENLYLFKPQQSEVDKMVRQHGKQILSKVTRVESWKELTEHFRRNECQ